MSALEPFRAGVRRLVAPLGGIRRSPVSFSRTGERNEPSGSPVRKEFVMATSYRRRQDDPKPTQGFAVDLNGTRYYLSPEEVAGLAQQVKPLQILNTPKGEIEQASEEWLLSFRRAKKWVLGQS
jgi:hypothetical protein